MITPPPAETLILYKNSLREIRDNVTIRQVLLQSEFNSANWELAHERLWTEILNQSYDLSSSIIDQAITTLIEFLPKYPLVAKDSRGLREVLIYALLQLLDRGGWGASSNRRDPKQAIEIAWRIFGEDTFSGSGILNLLVAENKGVLGWFDLLLFRLQCSADRQGQLHQLINALIRHQNPDAETTGRVDKLAIFEMRYLSQQVFYLFKSRYINTGKNFYDDAYQISDNSLLGILKSTGSSEDFPDHQTQLQLLRKKSAVGSFIIYQLSNTLPPNGSGVGCGYYDEKGEADNKEIAKAMNDYLFDFCFNPKIESKNAFYFFDHCLRNLTNPFFTDDPDGGLVADKKSLAGGLDLLRMEKFWSEHHVQIKKLVSGEANRTVYTSNYDVQYVEIAPKVFAVLDELSNDTQII